MAENAFAGQKTVVSGASGTIGSAIVKRIVEAHHGAVDVISHEGVGSTFALSLPAVGRAD